MKITENFQLNEFNCKDGTPYPEVWIESRLRPLCESLEVIREALGGNPIIINSGFRTPSHNQGVGGKKGSEHPTGKGCDFKVKGIPTAKIFEVVNKLMDQGLIREGGIGLYKSHVHYDIRGRKVVWRG